MSIIVIGGFVGFINFGCNNVQGTIVSGSIIIDTTWNLVSSPYIVIGDIWVEEGVTLNVEPGVEVKFDGGYSIIVNGSFIAIGTETDRINITSNKVSPKPLDWNRIKINSLGFTGYTEIKYCDISYASEGIYLYFSSSMSNNNIITDITLTNNGCGISLFKSSENIIINNTFSNNGMGILIHHSNGNIIVNNTFFDEGICIWGDQLSHYNSHIISDDNIVNGKPLYYYKDCSGINIYDIPVGELILANCSNINVKNIQINKADMGILAAYSTNITIVYNKVLSNDYGIILYELSNSRITNNDIINIEKTSIGLEWSSNNIIANNDVMNVGGVGIFLANYANNNIVKYNNITKSNMEGIRLSYSSNNTISNNYVLNNEDGICLWLLSNNNTVMNNIVISNNVHGIWLHSSSNNTLNYNNVITNNNTGIEIGFSSNHNFITENNLSGNKGYGATIYSSSYNRIYHNIIYNNAIQAFDDMNDNAWNDSYPSGGNYWSDFDEPGDGAYDDYQGTFQAILGSDGIVDNGTVGGGGMNPYIIDSDSMDHYPLLRNYIFLHEGWNLISIPLIQSDTNLDTVLSSISGSYDAVQYYNISDSSDPWKHNHISKPSLWNDLNEINHRIGFWIHITRPGGVIFECPGIRPPVNQTITLHPGWNLVGYPSLSSKVRMEALNNINFGSDVDAIWTYNTTGLEWEEMTKVDYFERGRGYWVHSNVEKIWIVPL